MPIKHLLRNEDIFQLAFVHAPIGMAIISTDGQLIQVNDSVCSIVGYTADELTGLSFLDITHPDDVKRNWALIGELLDGKRESYQLEKRYIHKKGHVVWVLLRSTLLRDGDGEPQFFISQITDITGMKQSELELRLSKLRYQSLFEHHPDLIYSLDMDGYLTFANQTFHKTFGYGTNDFKERPFHLKSLTAPESMHQTEVGFQAAANGMPQRYEAVGIDSEGNRIVFDVTNIPIVVDGEIIGVHGLSRDISKQKELWEKLQESQEMYRLISDNSQDMITYSSMDGTTLFISPALTKVLGYEPWELIGKPFSLFRHPDDADVDGAALVSEHSDTKTHTCRILHKDGHYVWIETTSKIVRDTKGEEDKILGVGRDITKRKRAENELRATKERLESFIDHNIDPIMVFDADNRLIQVNESFERTFGWNSAEIVGQLVIDIRFVAPEMMPELKRNLALLNAGQPVPSYETIRLCKDGTRLNVNLTAFPLRDEQGNISGYSVSLRDITDRKQAEELMINSEKLSIAGQLAAGIAHEIRNPITAIKGFIQLLKSGYTEKRQYFDIMLSEIARIEMISSELLLLAKPQTVMFTRKDVGLLLKQVKTLLDSQAIMSNVQIVTDFDPETACILCDENQLKQVWINFIKNAIEAMPDGGKIHIRMRRQGRERIVVSIVDEGCGIPEPLLSKLGQPFYTTKEKGTGLGFMVSKRIIENHNGTITVRSRENVGTTVEVGLPYKDE
ncbi:PAS domain S-box protein [Paenibacillus mesophilus]|uniref:PAS domain S-box protein n=1 Tax=Paenibacillus mesophilus TaxID=2582849 RepID=UPI00110EAA6F|nr:PAS domain S-box protein [Paenibacillus mesophilus]TMV48928.1 PAS domain S-box protein [Paenibacillus mesophilus]